MEKVNFSKRKFFKNLFKFLGLGLLIGFLYKYLLPKKNNYSNVFRVKLSRIPGEGALIIPQKKLAILKINGEILVLSTVCTHLGCNVSFSKNGFACPCHGSKFDIWGNVVKGPAIKPLKKVPFKIYNDEIRIFI